MHFLRLSSNAWWAIIGIGWLCLAAQANNRMRQLLQVAGPVTVVTDSDTIARSTEQSRRPLLTSSEAIRNVRAQLMKVRLTGQALEQLAEQYGSLPFPYWNQEDIEAYRAKRQIILHQTEELNRLIKVYNQTLVGNRLKSNTFPGSSPGMPGHQPLLPIPAPDWPEPPSYPVSPRTIS